MLILNADDILRDAASSEDIGGKALGLCRLSNLGFNVPDWFCIHTNLFSLLKKRGLLSLDNAENFTKYQELIEERGFLDQLNRKLENIPNHESKLFAVRSSANLEDSSKHSFAGLFESYLNVSKNEVSLYIYKALCDVYSDKVSSYCQINSIDSNKIKCSIVIQEMVVPKMAGVCFSINPINENENELLISSVPGLGDKLVDGTCVANNYRFNRKKKLLDKEIEFFEIDDTNVIAKVCDISKEIEKNWGVPVDIEWAYDGKVKILQTRPITTLKKENCFVIDNSNIVESFPGVTLPLTFSFAQNIYALVFNDSLESLSLAKKSSVKAANNLIHYYKGRIFYNLSSWYEMMLSFPLVKYYLPIWEESLGIKNGLDIDANSLSFFARMKYTVVPLSRFLVILFSLKKRASKLEELIIRMLRTSRDNFCNVSKESRSIDDFMMLMKNFSRGWDVTLINDIYVFVFSAIAKRILSYESDNYKLLFNEYVIQSGSLESIRPLESMIKMAKYLKDNGHDINPISLPELKIKSSEFSTMFDHHISDYGDRSLEDLKLESITFRQDPELLYIYIKSMIDLEDKGTPKTSLDHEFRNPITKKLFHYFMNKAKSSIEIRERFRLYRSRFYGVARDFFMHFGQKLVTQRRLLLKTDITYLSLDELRDESLNYLEIVEKRKKEYDSYKSDNKTSPRFMVKGNRYDPVVNNIDVNLKSYEGTACSQGIVTAQVVVVTNLEDVRENPSISKGKILVSPMTDPGWVYLMKNSVGLIVEKGSILSHSAIIGRELGLPTIVNIPSITDILKTGQVVTLDSYNGVVIIHE